MALMARAYNQAQKIGVEMAIPDEAISLEAPLDSKDGPVRSVVVGIIDDVIENR